MMGRFTRSFLGAAAIALMAGAAPLLAAERFIVAADVAHGLAFLHTAASPAIIHQDIKSENILLRWHGGARRRRPWRPRSSTTTAATALAAGGRGSCGRRCRRC